MSTHVPCESCGSSDGGTVYEDGHYHCYVCGKHKSSGSLKPEQRKQTKMYPLVDEKDLYFSDLSARKLTEKTCQKWGYRCGIINGKNVQVANYYNPLGTEVVAQKLRYPDKSFAVRGDISAAGLFGQHLWKGGGKKIIITEGEIDAMTVSQIQEHKWPVVSIPNGANAAKDAIQRQLEWLSTFDEVVLMFDADEAGRKAVQSCVDLFEPGKVSVANLPMKDPNELLKAGRPQDVINAIWNPTPYRPDGIVSGEDVWTKVTDNSQYDTIPYAIEGLNKKLIGDHRGCLTLWTGGTGNGKSEILGQLVAYHHILSNEKVGYVALEESVQRTAFRLMGLHLSKLLHIDPTCVTDEERRKAFDEVIKDKACFYDHFGSMDETVLLSRIRYMAKSLGCTTIILDHVSIVVSGMDTGGDERKIIDLIMTRLACLCRELRVRMHAICHLVKKKGEGKTYEEGGQITLNDLRGSGSLAQLSDNVIALERNQQSEKTRNITKVRVLKCRRTGRTGLACLLKYDDQTGRVTEMDEAVEKFDEEDEKDSAF